MSVPNRHPVRDAPKWTAQPLPQTKRFGEREYILKKCAITQAPKNRQGSFSKWPEPFFGYFDTELEVRDHGAVTGGYAIMASFEDATGNSDSYSLPAGERVWRYRVSVQPQNLWKYHADDVWPLGSVSVPAAGQYQQLNLPAKAAERGIVAAAVLGPGGYVWQDGKCTTAVAMAPNSQGLNAVSVQADRRYRADLSPDHAVVMVIWFGRTPTDLLDIKFRVKSGEEPRELYREGGSGRWVSTPHPFAVEYYRLEARDTKLSANPFELEMVDARVDSVVFTIPAPDLPPPPR